jgi:hypothetical protein
MNLRWLWLIGIGACAPAVTPSKPPPSFTQDVRPILEHRCFKCHAGDGVAADEHDFSKFPTLFAQRQSVANAVSKGVMPPSGEPPLPKPQADIVTRWIASGARE